MHPYFIFKIVMHINKNFENMTKNRFIIAAYSLQYSTYETSHCFTDNAVIPLRSLVNVF